MTDDDVIPVDTQQWLTGIGARLPGASQQPADTPAPADDPHPDSDGVATPVDLDDHHRSNSNPADHVVVGRDDVTAGSASDVAPPAYDVAKATINEGVTRAWFDRWRGRFNPRVAAVMAAVTVLGTAATAALTVLDTTPAASSHPEASPTHTRPTPPPPHPSSTSAPTGDENLDGPIPFLASSDCDPAGSTPAQSLADPSGNTPWVCVLHGAGQVLTLQLGPPGIPQAYVITSVSIIPGAIGPKGRRPTDPDPWLAHHVVTLLQYHFTNPGNLFLDQNTYNTRGEVPMPVPHVLASTITIIIRQTSRPPTDPTPTPT
ncbi:hypothetical protein AWC17_26010, partial [Mycobacterium nebraskense]